MRLQLLLIAATLLGITIQAVASNAKAPNPPPPVAPAPPKIAPPAIVPTAIPTATFTAVVVHNVVTAPTATFTTVIVHNVVSVPTATFTPVFVHNLPFTSTATAVKPVVFTPTPTPTFTSTPISTYPGVTVWPEISKGGQPILFKAPFDKGSVIQLSIQSMSGLQVFQTSFSKTGRSGGYVWRLENQTGSPVLNGVYVYSLRFKQQGQLVTVQGKVSITR